MYDLPSNLKVGKRTPDFDQNSVPAGLLGQHSTAENVWGVINVTEGNLIFRTLEPEIKDYRLDASHKGIVAPTMAHQVIVDSPVKFHVQFMNELT